MADDQSPPTPRPRLWLRWLLTPALAAAALLVGVTAFITLASMKEPPPQVEPAKRIFRVPVFVVGRQNVRILISTFGTARPEQEAMIAAEVAGRVVDARGIDVGLTVGLAESASPPVLVRIDPQTYEQRVLQAEALLAQDAAELAKLAQDVQNTQRLLTQKQQSLASAKSQLELQQRLIKEGAGRETELRRAELEYQQVEAAALQLQSELDLEDVRRDQLHARRASHQRDLELARLDVTRANISAPFPGVISEVHVETGQYVRPGEPLFQLTNVDRVEIPLPLPVGKSGPIAQLLQSGEQPRVQLAEHESAECRWVGRVTRMAPVANEMTRTVDVYAEVDNRQSRDMLRPGTFVHARIEGGVEADVILIPRGAVFDEAVFIARPTSATGTSSSPNAVAQRRPVKVAKTLHNFAVISSGLEPGDRVILSNLDVLSDGAQLKLIEERNIVTELERDTIPAFELVDDTQLSGPPAGRSADDAPDPGPRIQSPPKSVGGERPAESSTPAGS